MGFSFLHGLEARKEQRYKWGAYCRTNWRCIAVLSLRPVGVGVSETLLRSVLTGQPQKRKGRLQKARSSRSLKKRDACRRDIQRIKA